MAKQKRGVSTRIKLVGGEVTFSMQDSQLVEMRQPLDHYTEGSKNFSPVFEEFWQYHRRSIQRNFEAEGRPEKWAPLKAATIRERIRLGYGAGPILVRTGALKRGFRADWGPRSYRVSNLKFYFPFHQQGAPRANIPARPMLTLLPQDLAQFTRIARKHLGADE